MIGLHASYIQMYVMRASCTPGYARDSKNYSYTLQDMLSFSANPSAIYHIMYMHNKNAIWIYAVLWVNITCMCVCVCGCARTFHIKRLDPVPQQQTTTRAKCTERKNPRQIVPPCIIQLSPTVICWNKISMWMTTNDLLIKLLFTLNPFVSSSLVRERNNIFWLAMAN